MHFTHSNTQNMLPMYPCHSCSKIIAALMAPSYYTSDSHLPSPSTGVGMEFQWALAEESISSAKLPKLHFYKLFVV